VEYAARKKGSGGVSTCKETVNFTESSLSSATPMACDAYNATAPNHSDGINVVYFDSHVEFMPDGAQYVGGRTTGVTDAQKALMYMDDGQ
jgi:prepilin-type processing-associated H-X9-DG protein